MPGTALMILHIEVLSKRLLDTCYVLGIVLDLKMEQGTKQADSLTLRASSLGKR